MITNFDAVIFDMDGVITDTASVHSKAWKQAFDDFLKSYAQDTGTKFKSFSLKNDYLKYVDGKPRYDGVRSFLSSRGISLPDGNPDDFSETRTICGLGNRKNSIFNEILRKEGAVVFRSTIDLIKELIENDIKIGVASSSKNCPLILKEEFLDHFFEVCIDGNFSAEKGLKGKPAPDIFTTACDILGVSYDRAVVVEDAVSGVAAGKAGSFGLVIGVARHDNHKELKLNGADIVVSDLSEINAENIETWFEAGLEEDSWSIKYCDFERANEKHKESLLTIGNGVFASRGCFAEEQASKTHYPGTYMAGVYNKLKSKIANKTLYNEDFVNCPNWIFTSFRINGGKWVNSKNLKILDIERKLDLRRGMLTGWVLLEDSRGRQTMVESLRYISMANKHLAGIEYSVTPLNYSGQISIKTGIDGKIKNDGVERYRELNRQHLKKAKTSYNDNTITLKTKTSESKIEIDIAASIITKQENVKITYEEQDSSVFIILTKKLTANTEFCIRKVVAINNSLLESKQSASEILFQNPDFHINSEESIAEWAKIWRKTDIRIGGDRKAQKLIRLHNYHIISSVSPLSKNLDISIGARGLHGEAYRGHIFWDELYILPFYNIHFPELTKTMLKYRYKRLDAAREYAKENGYSGAMFPWQSGSSGCEETQEMHLNPKSGEWGPDYSRNQRHVSLAIANNIIRYYNSSNDRDFMNQYGFEMLTEICRFFASACKYSEKDNKFHLDKVMGPDEFHEKYPDKKEGGLKNNAYTNIMLSWVIKNCLNLYYNLYKNSENKSQISAEELDLWQKISQNLYLNVNYEGIIEQFEGYFNLKELDWEHYKKKYGNIYRLDRILKAEGKSPDNYKLAKQADTLMIFYNLSDKELNETFIELGITIPADYKINNFNYYIKRTSHGSTLSRVVHSWLANDFDLSEWSWDLYSEALGSDFYDIQGGTTSEGIHAGVMAATIMQAICSFAGTDIRGKAINISPKMPKQWQSIGFSILFREVNYQIEVTHKTIGIKTDKDVGVLINNMPCIIQEGVWWNIDC